MTMECSTLKRELPAPPHGALLPREHVTLRTQKSGVRQELPMDTVTSGFNPVSQKPGRAETGKGTGKDAARPQEPLCPWPLLSFQGGRLEEPLSMSELSPV